MKKKQTSETAGMKSCNFKVSHQIIELSSLLEFINKGDDLCEVGLDLIF